jgi:hypothetical protein
MTRRTAAAALVVLGGLAAACESAARTTETFTGTVDARASTEAAVVLTVDGEVDATLDSINPAVAVGLGFGTPTADGACTLLASNAAATVGTIVSTDAGPGTYCVLVYDVGNLSGSATFTLTVAHP